MDIEIQAWGGTVWDVPTLSLEYMMGCDGIDSRCSEWDRAGYYLIDMSSCRKGTMQWDTQILVLLDVCRKYWISLSVLWDPSVPYGTDGMGWTSGLTVYYMVCPWDPSILHGTDRMRLPDSRVCNMVCPVGSLCYGTWFGL